MKKRIIAAAYWQRLLHSAHLRQRQVSKQNRHFKLVKVGTVGGGRFYHPPDLREKRQGSRCEGGKYYHIIAAREHGPNFEGRCRSL